MSEYPEHDRQELVRDKALVAGEFYDWLTKQGIHLVTFDNFSRPCNTGSPAELLARWLGIDLAKIETEKRAMLETMRMPRTEMP